MIYKATLDKTTKTITICTGIFFVLVVLGIQIFSQNQNIQMSLLLVVILLILYGVTYAIHPLSYELDEKTLTIHRAITNKTIALVDIIHIEKVSNTDIKYSLRLCGVGGLFGYMGLFWNKKFGLMTWYATRIDTAILLSLQNNKKIVITPDDSEQFIQACNKK